MLKNLKVLRNKKGVSQLKLAESVGVSQQSINKYENHYIEPDIDTLIKLADYFSTSVDYLIGHTDSDRIIENVRKFDLNKDEAVFIDGYRELNKSEKESIRLIIKNYNAKK
jgi:transcriptional regulator with XRE-family HTH domain